MATLLHIDSSLNGDNSVSRAVGATFRAAWEQQHPDGTVVYRDLATDPIPHLDSLTFGAGSLAEGDRTPEQQEAWARREKLIEEFETADAVLLGAPMYNWAIPSTLKAWLDHVILVGRTAGGGTVEGKPVTVIASRGGSYKPGTPNEGHDYIEPYLAWVLGDQLKTDLHCIVPELTLARTVPAMKDLIGLSDSSRDQAHEAARNRAKTLATQLSA
ncbi:FMN-dependent NADH-azoreductase [Streptomyces sp. PT12]|uniref:FMN-dependent NADH-azoreductase n=1 Tax=Streptomyces sp. PT12 TaxID=1510197 RepID=UPI000DE36401|nr:NAD(P)H-dependent oxidoreductase [Streptomyces sp. PT12]RBM05531.1 FMN-dependent NADH-azoreductase [Streptomyces sp. PT12]